MSRIVDGLKEIPHAFVDFFVRPLKIWFPQPVTFWRPDNDLGFVKDTKPLGYWLGHIVVWGLLLGLAVYIIMTATPPEMFVDEG